MYGVLKTTRFEKSFLKLLRSGTFKSPAQESFEEAVIFLMKGDTLPASYVDHRLSGDFAQYRECHIKGDVLLLYEKRDDIMKIILVDIGSHSYLFG